MKHQTTIEEWQDAVDMAKVLLENPFLLIESAQQYGLLNGNPTANIDRCREILKEGKQRGVAPAPDCVEKYIAREAKLATKRRKVP